MDRVARARRFAALGDPVRLGVVELLAGGDLSPQALCEALQVSSNLMAHHLQVLAKVGLVERRRSDGDRRRWYVHALPLAVEQLVTANAAIPVPRVVFVCTANSARSVLAEAIWREHSDVPSASAGTHPADRVNRKALQAARRAGLHLVEPTPRRVDDVVRAGDLIVSVCDSANEELDAIRSAHVHWSIPDPGVTGTDAAFDRTVIELTERIGRLAPDVRLTRRRATR